MTALLVFIVAFVGMEGVSYCTHRFVMHGFGYKIHADHHRPSDGGFEANDLYPLSFSSLAIVFFALGAWVDSMGLFVPAGLGLTLYGVLYLFVHEIYIHQRLRLINRPLPYLEWLRRAHRVHHLYGGEPYGMLFPVVPRELWERAAGTTRNPLARPAAS
jgi:beta-carotene 3-hydroxylase